MESSDRNDVDWRALCEQASKEQDPDRLIELVQRLNEALEERRHRRIQRQFDTAPSLVPAECGEGPTKPIFSY